MGTINTIHPYRVDLEECPLAVQLTQPLNHQDALADVFTVAVRRGMKPVDLTGMTVTAYLTFGETRQTLPLSGTVNGSTASVTLTADCYKLPGLFTLVMQLQDGEVRHTILRVCGLIDRTACDDLIASGDLLPTLSELLAEIDGMREATSAAHAASEEALAAAGDSEQRTTAAIADVNKALGDALDAASGAMAEAAPAIVQEISDEIVSVPDAAARPALSLVSRIGAVQQGSGVPSPDNIRPLTGWDALSLIRTGRNMLDPAALRQVQISTGETRWGMRYARPGTYALHAGVPGGYADYVYAQVTDAAGAALGDTMHLVTTSVVRNYAVTLEAGQALTVWYVRDLDQASAAECMSRTQVQVEMGVRTAYVPGQSTAITAALPETIFGGSLDWTSGMLTVTHRHLALDGTEAWTASIKDTADPKAYYWTGIAPLDGNSACDSLCSHYAGATIYSGNTVQGCYVTASVPIGATVLLIRPDLSMYNTLDAWKDYLAAQAAAGTPVQVVYELATPYAIQLEPQTLALLRGDNAIWSDAGATSAAYVADTKIYIDNAVAAIAASVINA